ncbi:MAG: hypothetical protein ACLTOV_09870 [Phocaeicola sp.]
MNGLSNGNFSFYLNSHRRNGMRRLALQTGKTSEVDMAEAVNTADSRIGRWQRKKVPLWAGTEGTLVHEAIS